MKQEAVRGQALGADGSSASQEVLGHVSCQHTVTNCTGNFLLDRGLASAGLMVTLLEYSVGSNSPGICPCSPAESGC